MKTVVFLSSMVYVLNQKGDSGVEGIAILIPHEIESHDFDSGSVCGRK